MINPVFDSSGDDFITTSDKQVDQRQGLELKRTVGLLSGISFIVGSIIGTGIFITPGGILERTGSVGMALVMWAACGVLAILGSLAYAELGTLIPTSGGEYSYYLEGFGKLHPFWGPLPAFLYSWINTILLRPLSNTIGCMSFATYTIVPLLEFLQLCPSAEEEKVLIELTTALALGLITAINCYSMKVTIHVQNVLTVAKLAAIVLIIGCGFYRLCINGGTRHLSTGFQGSIVSFGSIATAFYGGLYSFEGWNGLNYITEELTNPHVNLPRAIVIAIPFVIVCYEAVNVAYLTVLSPSEIVKSSAVAVDFANRTLGPASFLIPLSVALSAFGSVLAAAVTASRVCLASAREGHLISVLSYIHVDSRVPSPAAIFTNVMSLIYIFMGDLASLIDFFSLCVWFFYWLSMVVLLLLRKIRPDAPRPYKVQIWIPVAVMLIAAYLVVAPLVTDPALEYLYAAAILIVGFFVYIPFVYLRVSVPRLDGITKAVQLILKVGPTKNWND